jgi:hypothetical protein
MVTLTDPNPHAALVTCPYCSEKGAVIWEEVVHPSEGRIKEMIRIEGGFYERISRKAPHPIELVCGRCAKSWLSPLQP